MAIDKAVDSAKLDAALVATADAIRAKGGGTAKLAWKETNGFADEIDTLPEAVPEVTQATPSISVSSGGLITASATQSAGKVAAGTKSATKQLTTQGAKTVTPTASEQVAVPAGVFTTGAVKVAAVQSANVTNVAGYISQSGIYTSITITGLSYTEIEEVTISQERAYSFLSSSDDTSATKKILAASIMKSGWSIVTALVGNSPYDDVATYIGAGYMHYTYSNGTLTIFVDNSDFYFVAEYTYNYGGRVRYIVTGK